MELASLPETINQLQYSRSRESLAARSLDLDLTISDEQGRSASLRIDLDELLATRQYTRLSVQRPDSFAARGAEANRYSTHAVLEQHQEVVYARSLQIEASGDLDLLSDAFSAEHTAQRIVDHMAGLLDGLGDQAFDQAFSAVRAGVAEGFAQAEALLGGLADISVQTRGLVDDMLQLLGERGPAGERVLVDDVRPPPTDD